MEKEFYFKKRFGNEIEGPESLVKIQALNDSSNIQITDFKSEWIWLSEFLNNIKKAKK